MVERYFDKKLKILRSIIESRNRLGVEFAQISNTDIELQENDFHKILMDLNLEFFNNIELDGDSMTSENGKMTVLLTILNLDELEKDYERLNFEYPKRDKPLLKDQTNELIAREIGGLTSGVRLADLLKKFGVDQQLIVYPNTKWIMIYDILNYLSISDRDDDFLAFQKILTEFCHPLTHSGDIQKAKEFEKLINSWLEYDGYQIHGDKIILITENIEKNEHIVYINRIANAMSTILNSVCHSMFYCINSELKSLNRTYIYLHNQLNYFSKKSTNEDIKNVAGVLPDSIYFDRFLFCDDEFDYTYLPALNKVISTTERKIVLENIDEQQSLLLLDDNEFVEHLGLATSLSTIYAKKMREISDEKLKEVDERYKEKESPLQSDTPEEKKEDIKINTSKIQSIISPWAITNLTNGTTFEDLSLELIGDGERVRISCKNSFIKESHYSDIGFADSRSPKECKPKFCWKLLQIGAMNSDSINADTSNQQKFKIQQKQISTLSQMLKQLFPNVHGAPINKYDQKNKNYVFNIHLRDSATERVKFVETQKSFLGNP